MSLVIKFKDWNDNEFATRQFQPGQELRIWVDADTLFGMAGGLAARFEMTSKDNKFAPYFAERETNFWGNAWVDITLPTVISLATVKVTVEYPLSVGSPSVDIEEVPIAIGDLIPGEVDAPKDYGILPELPEAGKSLGTVLKWAPWVALAAGVAYLAPMITRQYQKG